MARRGMKLLTIGTFDIPHVGHLNLISKCTQLADEVYIGINSDKFVERYKGKPVMTQEERAKFFEYLGLNCLLNDGPGDELIREVRPDILAIGSDWARRDYLKQINMTQDELDEQGTMLLYIPYYQEMSTTEIKKRIR